MLTSEQIAAVAAREARDGECVSLDGALAAKVRRYLSKGVRVAADENGASQVDVVFLTANKICDRGDLIHSARAGSKTPCDWSSVPSCNAKRIVVIMPHTAGGNANIVQHRRRQEGEKKSLRQCRVITDLAILDITEAGVVLREVAPGVSARDVQEATGTVLFSGPDLSEIEIS